MNLSLAQVLAFGLATVGAQARDIPPNIPDKFHVPNGCVVSTQVYINKLAEVRPDLRARPLHMERHGEEHVMALVTNRQGEQYARDEFVGVLDLKANESENLPDAELGRRAVAAHRVAEKQSPYEAPRAETTRQERDAAARVGQLIPSARVYKTADSAFTIWEASPTEKFVYVATRGTMTIEPRAGIPEPKLAAALAQRLGLGALQQQQQTTQTRQTAALTR